jgi:hypothetical protein
MPGICWWYLFHKKVKGSFSTAPDIFKPLLINAVFSNALPGLMIRFFDGEHRVFSESGSQDLSNGTNVAS